MEICNHCGSTDIFTKVWFCWSCCKGITTQEVIDQQVFVDYVEAIEASVDTEKPELEEEQSKEVETLDTDKNSEEHMEKAEDPEPKTKGKKK